jgi:hypothetical protein
MSWSVIVERLPPPAGFGTNEPSFRFNHTHRFTEASPAPNRSAISG